MLHGTPLKYFSLQVLDNNEEFKCKLYCQLLMKIMLLFGYANICMECSCLYRQISGVCYSQGCTELKYCCRRALALLVKKICTAIEYEYSMKYIQIYSLLFFFFQYVNWVTNSKSHRIYYGQLLCPMSFYIRKAGSVLVSVFLKLSLLSWAALMEAQLCACICPKETVRKRPNFIFCELKRNYFTERMD